MNTCYLIYIQIESIGYRLRCMNQNINTDDDDGDDDDGDDAGQKIKTPSR